MRKRLTAGQCGSESRPQIARRLSTTGVAALGVVLWLGGVGTRPTGAQEFEVLEASPGARRASGVSAADFAAARPLPSPRFDAAAARVSEAAWRRLEEAGHAEPIAVEGGRPDPDMAEFVARLREESLGAMSAPDGARAPEAAGTSKAYFTSHALIPQSADLEYPYSTAGLLFFRETSGGAYFVCSASVIRHRLIATAAQCVHGGRNVGFYRDFVFVPAYRNNSSPFGSWDWAFVSVPATWSQASGTLPNAADYAVIELDDLFINGATRRIGDVVGFLGFITSKLFPNHTTTLGYPSNVSGGNFMRQSSAQSFKKLSNNTVQIGSDFTSGAGGGPILQDFGDNPNKVKWIGTASFFGTSAQKLMSASIPDSRFTSILNTACAHRSGNC